MTTKQEIQELRKELAQLLKEVKEFREEQRVKGWNNFPVIQVSPEQYAVASGNYDAQAFPMPGMPGQTFTIGQGTTAVSNYPMKTGD